MFRSEKLSRIMLQVPDDLIGVVTAQLVKFRLLHLIRIQETHIGRLGYLAETNAGLQQEYEELLSTTGTLLESLAIQPPSLVLPEAVIPEHAVFKLKERLQAIQIVVEGAASQLQNLDQSCRNLQDLEDKLTLLPGDLDLRRLATLQFIDWTIGLVPTQGLERLAESLSQVHHAVLELGRRDTRSVVLVFGLKPDWPVLERALKGAFFDRIEIPAETSGVVAEILQQLASERTAKQARLLELSGQRARFQQQFGAELVEIREKTVMAQHILSARRFFGKIDKSYLISGWIPDRQLPALETELQKRTAGKVLLDKIDPQDSRRMRDGIVRIPILFNNPFLIRPFEKLTSLYGTPRYEEVEPTALFAVTFLLMFGMMFGDVGQGGILFILGYTVFRRLYKYMDYGIILMECGLSSVCWGFLYGSLFGLENVIPALWFRPMADIGYFIRIALGLGMIFISLGMILNLINSIKLKEYQALFGTGGLAGALLYWMFAGLGMKYLVVGRVASTELAVAGWTAALLIVIIILHRPVYRLLIEHQPWRQLFAPAGLFTELLESLVELVDDMLRFLANTISFIRLAAFALSHAALFAAVFSIADILARKHGGGISYWLVLALGNAVIILLEGLVVSIQTIRLEYYEFFSKFFRGGGERFQGLKIDN